MLQWINQASGLDTNLFDSFLLMLLCNLLKAETEALVTAMQKRQIQSAHYFSNSFLLGAEGNNSSHCRMITQEFRGFKRL